MSPVGPQLPRGLEKRKRDEDDSSSSSEDDEYGPTMPHVPQKRKSPSPESASKRPRTIGPTLPPANLNERPHSPPEGEELSHESSDDDGYGPALPSKADNNLSYISSTTTQIQGPPAPKDPPSAIQRDEWMLVPPTSGDWSSRVDPTKLKARKFNTGKSAKGPSQAATDDNAKWTETPAEKAARLQREMMGIRDSSSSRSNMKEDQRANATAKKLREFTDKSRGEALYSEHQRQNPSEKEDDPSARAFDREKDIAGGVKISHTQRKELLRKAADFGSRFSSGKFL